MKAITIDFSKYPDVEAFHKDIAQLLDFPAYYGNNLDALHDMIDALPDGAYQFEISYGGQMPQRQQEIIARILLGE